MIANCVLTYLRRSPEIFRSGDELIGEERDEHIKLQLRELDNR